MPHQIGEGTTMRKYLFIIVYKYTPSILKKAYPVDMLLIFIHTSLIIYPIEYTSVVIKYCFAM